MTPRFGAEVVREMRANGRENVDIHILPDAGHYAFIDQAEAANEIINARGPRVDDPRRRTDTRRSVRRLDRACAYIVYDVYIKVVLYSFRGALHVER